MRVKESLELAALLPSHLTEAYHHGSSSGLGYGCRGGINKLSGFPKLPSMSQLIDSARRGNGTMGSMVTQVPPTPSPLAPSSPSALQFSPSLQTPPPPPYTAENSLSSFLCRLGCSSCLELFISQGLSLACQLVNLSLEDLNSLKVPEPYRGIIWKAIVNMKQGQASDITPQARLIKEEFAGVC
uniref:tumor protein 63-like n=1 Tax=Myxine glutinosa TaxID=7769 RepID=UPI00358FC9D9